jgi:hypothetical protein
VNWADRQLERAHDALQHCSSGLTLAQLTARPAGKWTIAEIFEHLALAFSGTAAGARRAVTSGRRTSRSPDLRSRFRAFVVIDCGYFPTGVDAPKMVVPAGVEPPTALPMALGNLREMDAALAEAETRFGARVRLIDHPILGPLSVRQWRRFHWVHTRHHVKQVNGRTVRES